ncbi:MAG TPA: DUF3426 domain-containing protein [Casimicrobiaceae bacterium]|nr:DUF3426 domain-containing protein [Casimicrobiaceae bacterium]
MAEQKFTRCPSCKTVFRVTSQQLAMRDGQVRCGHCRTVFDGELALVSLAPQFRAPDDEAQLSEAELGPPTVTLRNAQALAPLSETRDDRRRHGPPPIDDDEDTSPSIDPEIAYASRFSATEEKRRLRLPGWLYGMLIPVLVIALAAQALFHFRDAIAAHWPQTRNALRGMCVLADCQIRPLQDISGLSIEASDLQADPAHKGLLILAATIRNRTAHALAYPYLELTLSDAQEQVVVRRAFAPGEYLSGAADAGSGLAGNAELAVKLFIDASATTQAGYQVYLFYP